MGIVIAMAIAVAAAFGASHKDGLFNKGSDTTRKDTIAFERHALELKLARVEAKERKVYALNDADAAHRTTPLTAQKNELQERIIALEHKEAALDSTN